jgi:hypothetical protein
MLSLFRWLWKQFTGIFGYVLPMFRSAGKGLRPWLFWMLHIVVIAAILAGLGWLNYWADLPRYLDAPSGWLAQIWLPLLFSLMYVNLWVGLSLWKLLRSESKSSPFPDIDQAWDAAVSAAERAGIDLQAVPLFLLLGRPAKTINCLFDSGKLRVTQTVLSADSPVNLYVSRDAAYLVCPECCLLGALAEWLVTLHVDQPGGAASSTELAEPDHGQVNGDEVPSLEVVAETADSRHGDRDEATTVPPVVRDAAEIAVWRARLRHLCYRVRMTRLPYTPVNGIMVLIPEVSTRSVSAANQAGFFAAEDLQIVAEVLQVRCPVLGIVVDAEELPGMDEFLSRIPQGKRGQRLGRRLPYVPDLPAEKRASLVIDATTWICGTLLPRLIYRVMPLAEHPEVNAELFRLSATLAARREALQAVMTQSLAPVTNPAVMMGGFYLAATGAEPHRQGFLADVFAQLLESQNVIAWTPDGLAEERSFWRKTVLGYSLLVLFFLLGIVLILLASFGEIRLSLAADTMNPG